MAVSDVDAYITFTTNFQGWIALLDTHIIDKSLSRRIQ